MGVWGWGDGITNCSRITDALNVWGKKLDSNSEVLNRDRCVAWFKKKAIISIVLAIILLQGKRYWIFRLLFHVNTVVLKSAFKIRVI